MTCRHSADDTSCSSHPNYRAFYSEKEEKVADTPDASNYSIEDVQRIGQHLVLKVKYPNCKKCSYEGLKVMVFLDVTEVQVLHWRKIDPHFRDTNTNAKGEAPSPAAIFPGNAIGWADALTYARGKAQSNTRTV
jgi:hypothetical protein